MQPQTQVLFGQLLVEQKVITPEQLDTALRHQKTTGGLLGEVLVKLGFVDEETAFLPVLAGHLGVEFVYLRDLKIAPETIARVPAQFATYYKIMPVDYKDGVLRIATTHPFDVNIIDGLAVAADVKLKTVLASEKDILETIRKYYGIGAETIDQIMGTVTAPSPSAAATENIEEIDSEASIGKFINQILLAAYHDRATDIHIEPFEDVLKIRYRIDGVLYDTKVPENIFHFRDSINSRIKIMSNLNIAEKRLPQDGRFQVKVGEVELDLRVSFLPAQFGESVVIRLLSSTKLISLAELGLSSDELKAMDDLIRRPHGIVFVTGPTGSGKTTTLYSCLARINKPDRKIITIEDPIEYQLKGIIQVQVNPTIGLTFSHGLRSMLRHDPDIMMVGEVRDLETAEIAIQIALTGHLVFSTLHTNDAASGVTRLLDMGLEPYLICSAVECFIAQRLVRVICPRCKTGRKVTAEALQDFSPALAPGEEVAIYGGKGCKACSFTGYHGREGIFEFLLVTDDIRELIMARASAHLIRERAVSRGMKTLLKHGWEKVAKGITTPSEVIRVTKEEEGKKA